VQQHPATELAPGHLRPRREPPTAPPTDLASVAARVLARYGRHIVPVAVRLSVPVPQRFPLELVGATDAVTAFVRLYEPRIVSEGLYAHQAVVLAHLGIPEGRNVVLTSATGSGKSLAYWAWLLDRLARDPTATAVVAVPTQALLWSQAERIARLSIPSTLVSRGGDDQPAFAGRLDLPGAPIGWSVWKGTGAGETRDLAMEEHQQSEVFRVARIRIATIDKLHWSLLGYRSESFASRLDAVVLDEIHACDGLFGANVAFLLRRTRAVLGSAGRAAPAVFLASATLTDAEGFARRLLDLGPDDPLLCVGDVAEPQVVAVGAQDVPALLRAPPDDALERVVLVVDDPDDRITLAQTLGSPAVVGDETNIVYFSANKFASRRLLLRLGGAVTVAASGRHPLVYDADLPPKRRREIERTFNEGKARGTTLIATSALELGVDIEGLDLCVMDELPASRVALIQRIGRVGRRAGRPGLVVLRAGGQPLDRLLAADPVAALRLDTARALPLPLHLEAPRWRHALALHRELENRHVRAAVRELIVRDALGTGGNVRTIKRMYAERFGDVADKRDDFWFYRGFRASAVQTKVPVAEIGRWADGGSRPTARYEGGERCDIAWLDDLLIFRDAHPEAVLLGADGRRWRVVAYGGDATVIEEAKAGDESVFGNWLQALRIVFAEPVGGPIATRGIFEDSETLADATELPEGAVPPRGGTFVFGIFDVTRSWNGYVEINLETDAVRRVSAQEVAGRLQQAVDQGGRFPFLRRWRYRTMGWEWRVPMLDAVGPELTELVAALLAPHVAVAVESTLAGLAVRGEANADGIVLRILDAQPGGNGLSEALLHDERMRSALNALRRDIDGCQGDEKAFVRLVHRVVGEDPHAPLAEVECVVAVMAEAW
jgi:superfamily II DNA/RNA helicase